MEERTRRASRERDLLAAIAGGVAVGLLALTLPSPIALLGLIPALVAGFDFARRREVQPIGVLLIAAALSAGLPSGAAALHAWRTPGAVLEPVTAAVFGVACGAFVLGAMLLLAGGGDSPQ